MTGAEPELLDTQDAVDLTPGLARRAAFMGWGLFVAGLAVFGLTFVVALAYLQLD
jgi:hypothetical protein